MNADSTTQNQAMVAASCGRCCANCRFAMPVEHQGGPLLVCPYRQECRGRLTAVEPQEGCPAFRERVRRQEGPGEGTRFIPLVNMDGLCAMVDAADYEWLSRYTWRAMSGGGETFYACTRCHGKLCYMHRMIMNPPEGMVVDHKNRYGLDNHRVNLRNATPGQNNANHEFGAGASGLRGGETDHGGVSHSPSSGIGGHRPRVPNARYRVGGPHAQPDDGLPCEGAIPKAGGFEAATQRKAPTPRNGVAHPGENPGEISCQSRSTGV